MALHSAPLRLVCSEQCASVVVACCSLFDVCVAVLLYPSVVRPLPLIRLLVDDVETRHRRFLSARYAAAGNRATRESGGGVENTEIWKKNPGAFFLFF